MIFSYHYYSLSSKVSGQPRCVDPMLIQYWTDVADAGPTLNCFGSAEHMQSMLLCLIHLAHILHQPIVYSAYTRINVGLTID